MYTIMLNNDKKSQYMLGIDICGSILCYGWLDLQSPSLSGGIYCISCFL